MAQLNDPEAIRRLLVDTEVWAIVGLGANPHRPAYSVARFLQERVQIDPLPGQCRRNEGQDPRLVVDDEPQVIGHRRRRRRRPGQPLFDFMPAPFGRQ